MVLPIGRTDGGAFAKSVEFRREVRVYKLQLASGNSNLLWQVVLDRQVISGVPAATRYP